MEKRKEVLEAKVKAEEDKVKAFLRENKKSQAMMVLKRKKLLEKQIEGLDVVRWKGWDDEVGGHMLRRCVLGDSCDQRH